jgi:hypothetical protein
MPIRYSVGPDERAPRLSQDAPAQAIGPWTMCATSAIGSRAICAPSKEQPPAVAPGLGARATGFLLPVVGTGGLVQQFGDFGCLHRISPLFPVVSQLPCQR